MVMAKYDKLVLQPIGTPVVDIDVSSIPEYQRGQLAEFALELTRNIFASPGEEERYQAWLAKRKAAEAAKTVTDGPQPRKEDKV